MKISQQYEGEDTEPNGLFITWDNGKTVHIKDEHKAVPGFWRIIEILLQDANKEGGITALKKAEETARETIAAMKNKPRILT